MPSQVHHTKFNQIWIGSQQSRSSKLDSVIRINNERSVKRLKITTKTDSNRVKQLQFLTQKAMFSISEELLDLGVLYSALEKDLEGKNLVVDFALTQRSGEGKKVSVGESNPNYLTVDATSVFVSDFSSITMDFENATLIILKNGTGDLVLSVLLIGLVVGTLIHLYQTIKSINRNSWRPLRTTSLATLPTSLKHLLQRFFRHLKVLQASMKPMIRKKQSAIWHSPMINCTS